MSNVVSLHEYFYNLLIVNKVNNFTVTELRDALLRTEGIAFSTQEARLYVYRRILYLESKKLIVRTKSSHSKEVRYITTPLFESVRFKSKQTLKKPAAMKANSLPDTSLFYRELKKEKQIHEERLAIISDELEVFTKLAERYPAQKNRLWPFIKEAEQESRKEHSHVRAIAKVLSYPSKEL